MLTVIIPYFIHLVLKQVNVVVIVIILMIHIQELMKQGMQNGMKRVGVNVDQMQLFVIINNVGIKINVDANAKKQLIKECVRKDLSGILIIVSVNVINHVILVSIQIMKLVSAQKG